jgi:hypothetical protein
MAIESAGQQTNGWHPLQVPELLDAWCGSRRDQRSHKQCLTACSTLSHGKCVTRLGSAADM